MEIKNLDAIPRMWARIEPRRFFRKDVILHKILHRSRLSRQRDYKGLHRRHRYPVTVSCYTTGRDSQNGYPLHNSSAHEKKNLLKASVTGRRAIFLAGNPLTDARVL